MGLAMGNHGVVNQCSVCGILRDVIVVCQGYGFTNGQVCHLLRILAPVSAVNGNICNIHQILIAYCSQIHLARVGHGDGILHSLTRRVNVPFRLLRHTDIRKRLFRYSDFLIVLTLYRLRVLRIFRSRILRVFLALSSYHIVNAFPVCLCYHIGVGNGRTLAHCQVSDICQALI